MPYKNILLEVRGDCAVLTLNRPEKLNPLDWATVKELSSAVASLESEPAPGCVILTGSGRAFCAGGDLEGYVSLYGRHDDFRRFLRDFHRLLDAIECSANIYIAAVNGPCVAGGLELMLACDLVLAAESARIGDGHVNFGQLPGAGGSQRLPRAVGAIRAKHLMLSGALLDARAARDIGLVGEVVCDAGLVAHAIKLAADMAGKSKAGLRGMKYLVNQGLRGSLESGLELEMSYVHSYATTEPDAIEGLVAFAQKRKPRYRRG